jgi:hypothetical protein
METRHPGEMRDLVLLGAEPRDCALADDHILRHEPLDGVAQGHRPSVPIVRLAARRIQRLAVHVVQAFKVVGTRIRGRVPGPSTIALRFVLRGSLTKRHRFSPSRGRSIATAEVYLYSGPPVRRPNAMSHAGARCCSCTPPRRAASGAEARVWPRSPRGSIYSSDALARPSNQRILVVGQPSLGHLLLRALQV